MPEVPAELPKSLPVAPPSPKKVYKVVEAPEFVVQSGNMKSLWNDLQDFNQDRPVDAISEKELKTVCALFVISAENKLSLFFFIY